MQIVRTLETDGSGRIGRIEVGHAGDAVLLTAGFVELAPDILHLSPMLTRSLCKALLEAADKAEHGPATQGASATGVPSAAKAGFG